MLRGVLRAKRAVRLLQRFHTKDVQNYHLCQYLTTSTRIFLRGYSDKPSSSSAPLLWEVNNTTTPSEASSPPPSLEPFKPSATTMFFGMGFAESKRSEKLFQKAVREGDNTQIITGIEEHGLEIRDHFGSSPLYWAALSGQAETVRLLLSMGADVHARNLQLCTPLFAAAHKGCVKCIQLLIEKGASTNVKDFSGHTVLHYAAWNGTGAAVEELVKRYKMDVNATSNYLRTPLHYSAYQHDTIHTLITLGAKLDARDQHGMTPLHFAASKAGVAVKELVKAGANMEIVDIKGVTPIFHAITSNLVALRDLCEGGANVNYAAPHKTTPFMHAARLNSPECMKVLLNFGANLEAKDSSGGTALTHAIFDSSVEAVKFLVEKGCNTTEAFDGDVPLTIAVGMDRSVELVRVLVAGGAPVDGIETSRPLHGAAFAGKIEDMEELVRLGACLDQRTHKMRTPLFTAVMSGKAIAAEWLIKRGADVQARDKDQQTPLHLARTAECVELLVKAGANLNQLDSFHKSPLHVAAALSNIGVMQKLVELGADVNLVTKREVGTPLEHAAFASRRPEEAINALVMMGAKVNMPGTVIRFPSIFYAAKGEAVDALVDAGADVNEQSSNQSPLLKAAFLKRESVVRALLLKGANVNQAGLSSLITPLMSCMPNSSIAALLLEFGADVEVRAIDQTTALHVAAKDIDDVTFLPKLVPSAGVDVVDKFGITPLFAAAGNEKNMKKLLEMGANLEVALAKARELGETDTMHQLEKWKEKIKSN